MLENQKNYTNINMNWKTLFTIALLSFCHIAASAQITEREKTMSVGVYNALILELPDTGRKFAENIWKNYLKQHGGKTKKNKKAKEYFTDNISLAGIGSNIDVFSNVSESGGLAEVTIWVDLGEEYLNSYSHANRYVEAEKFLMRFALEVTREKIKLELEQEEKRLTKLKKNLKKLERANSNYHRDIRVAEERITKAKANIEQNEIDQEETKSAIDLQKEAVELVKKKLSNL